MSFSKLPRHKNKSTLANENEIVAAQVVNRAGHYEEEAGTALDKYIKNIPAMNKRTAHEYYARLIYWIH
jgi:hypothetical protein